jgi:hypothetical protein
MATRTRSPSEPRAGEPAETRARKPRPRTTTSPRKAASKRSASLLPSELFATPPVVVTPAPEPAPEPLIDRSVSTLGSTPDSALEPPAAAPVPPVQPVPVDAPQAVPDAPAGPAPPGQDLLLGVRAELGALRQELGAAAEREAAARAGALAQALRLATAAAYHLDQVSREVSCAMAQLRGLQAGLVELGQRLGQRDEEARAARSEQQREQEAVRAQLTELGQQLFKLNLRVHEDSAVSRKHAAELSHEVQRLLRALALPPR